MEIWRKYKLNNKKMLAFTAALSITAMGFFETNSASAEKYTIQEGDSLYKISEQFNTTVDALMEVNHLTSDLIYAGKTLEVSSNETTYIIEPGDTLFKIAAAHGASVEQLKRWNGLNSDLIYAGDTLSVSGPSKEVSVAQADQKATQTTTTNQTNTATTAQPTQSQSAPSNDARTMTVEATAYTANCTGCSGVTANGTDLRANPDAKVIAVDPSVIPLGTKVWVEGYGEAIAADTGGAIKGNRIDLFIANENEANEWGRRTVTIKILN